METEGEICSCNTSWTERKLVRYISDGSIEGPVNCKHRCTTNSSVIRQIIEFSDMGRKSLKVFGRRSLETAVTMDDNH